MNFLKAITTDGKTELFNVDNILTIQPNENGLTKILLAPNLYWWVNSESIEWVNCYNDLVATIKPKATEETHKFVIMSNDFEYTGGGVWVLFSELYLPNEETTIYATTDDSYCFFYYNKENFDECENPDYEIYCDNIEDAAPKYRDIARVLFAHFDVNLAKVGG
jgi:hypothetical protein